MSAKCISRPRRGVSLSEAMVSLLILTMVMIVALTLLFTMKSFAERQQVKTAPRQTSRRALDYVASYIAGATDMNDAASPPSPNAIVTWWARGQNNPTPKQASYNNVTDPALAELGTDIITVSIPTVPLKIPVTKWPGNFHSATGWVNYTEGCPDNEALKRNFLEATGADSLDWSKAKSGVLTVVDAMGNWAYYKIEGYQQAVCGSIDSTTGLPNPIHIVANPGQPNDRINPPGGQPTLVDPVSIAAGVRYMSFRVRNATDSAGNPILDANGNRTLNLEQKQGLFDPDTDNPGTAFTPVMPDVEDLQIAYLYSLPPDPSKPNRTIFNTAEALVTGDGNVPPQAGPTGAPSAWDITKVSGIRLSVTSRSTAVRFESRNISVRRGSTTRSNGRPASEDRAGAGPGSTDPNAGATVRIGDYDHHRMTSTALIRNRMLGN